MVVYNPIKTNNIEHHHPRPATPKPSCPCPHPHPHPHPHPQPQDACITIEVDGTPEIDADVVYGPRGKDGLINGYNEVEIIGGHNIDIEESQEPIGCHREKNILTINSITYDVDSENNDENNIMEFFEQVKPNSCWKIIHNLNKYPSVTVVTEEGEEIQCEVKYISINEVHLKFNGRFRGKAYLN